MTNVCLFGILDSSSVEVAPLPPKSETLAPALQLAVDLASLRSVSRDGATDVPCSKPHVFKKAAGHWIREQQFSYLKGTLTYL